MTDKDLIKKLFKIAMNQQKVITKLAQAAGVVETDEQKKTRWVAEYKACKKVGEFIFGKLSVDNPYKNDPLYGGEKPKPT